jgi:hypothetical protein
MSFRYFVTASATRVANVQGAWVLRPAATAHAKEMGTSFAACGANVASWPKLWEQPFVTLTGAKCPVCAQIATT